MSSVQRLREVWQRALEYGVYDDFPAETKAIVDQYADEAYQYCVQRFGSPKDAHKRWKIVQGERSFFYRPLGKPTITISKHAASKEQLCGAIAHEMYHRVTEGRKGLADKLWVKETMAVLTSQWFQQNQGFKEYVKRLRENSIADDGRADMNILRSSSPGVRRYVWFGTPVYSEAFSKSVWRIGYALNRAVDFSEISSLIEAKTLEEWINTLSQEDQYAICLVLEMPTQNKVVPHTAREVGRLFYALEAKGDRRSVVAGFERLADSQPTNGSIFFYLGRAYQDAKHFEDALTAYTRAEELGYSDRWLTHNIGSVYWHIKNYTLAAEWFGKAAEQSPDWAQPRYFLGRSLNNLGNVAAARQAWEEVRTLSDKDYAQLAEKALQENPLPEQLQD